MRGKKEAKAKSVKGMGADGERFGDISSKAELKTFLLNVRDKMADGAAAAIYSLSAMNFVMNLPDIHGLLDNENKELARDIWLRLKQAGVQLRNPPMLFTPEEEDLTGVNA
ncbi:MAG: hypothetical protein RL417_1294 [Pseudomonadota bacterium]|jgi:hypothetical protein